MTSGKKQVVALDGTVGVVGQASGERFAEITSGTSHWAEWQPAQTPETRLETEGQERQGDGRMSPYEQGLWGNAHGGDGTHLPNRGNTKVGQRGSGHLAVSTVSMGGRLDKTGAVAGCWTGDEAGGKPGAQGAYTNQRLNLCELGKAHRREPGFQTGPGKPGRPGL